MKKLFLPLVLATWLFAACGNEKKTENATDNTEAVSGDNHSDSTHTHHGEEHEEHDDD